MDIKIYYWLPCLDTFVTPDGRYCQYAATCRNPSCDGTCQIVRDLISAGF